MLSYIHPDHFVLLASFERLMDRFQERLLDDESSVASELVFVS